MAEDTKKIMFELPGEDPEFDALEEGETIERTVMVRKEPGGMACITEYEGMAMPEYDEEMEEGEDEAEEGGNLIDMMNQEEMA